MINGHGSDHHNYQFAIKADFSSNVVYQGVSNDLKKHLCEKISNLSVYPDPEASELRNRIALRDNVSPDQIVITNGSTEAFYLIAQLFAEKHSVIVVPAFAEYEDAARIHKHTISFINNSDFNKDIEIKADMVWFGNPNNPDGKTYSVDTINKICNNNPEKTVVVDEAYSLLCEGFMSAVTSNIIHNNLIIVRSLTKAFSIPGIRLGYMLASKDTCKRISQIKMPWSVNSLAIEAGNYIMDHYQQLVPDVKQLSKQSHQLQKNLQKTGELKVVVSDCNFFLIKTEKGDAAQLKEFLLREHGILIRDASNFRGLDKSHFRLAVQDDANNQKLVKAIKQWILQQQ